MRALYLGAVIVVIVIGYGAWNFSKTSLVKDRYTAFEQLNYVSWESLVSGGGASTLKIREQVWPKTSAYREIGFTRVSYNPILLVDYGYSGMSIEPHMLNEPGDKAYEFSKPYRLIGYVRTQVGQEEIAIMYLGWRSRSGKYSVITYAIPRERYESDFFKQNIDNYLGDKYTRPIMPMTHIASAAKCLVLAPGSQDYCAWYMGKREKIEELVLEWIATSELPGTFSQYPLLVSW